MEVFDFVESHIIGSYINFFFLNEFLGFKIGKCYFCASGNIQIVFGFLIIKWSHQTSHDNFFTHSFLKF